MDPFPATVGKRITRRGPGRESIAPSPKSTVSTNRPIVLSDIVEPRQFQERVVGPIVAMHGGAGASRLFSQYRDLTNLSAMLGELEPDMRIPFGPGPRDGIDWMDIQRRRFSRADTLLKSLYVQADVFLSILLQEALGGGGGAIHVTRYAKDSRNELGIAEANWLPAYALSTYRHKILIHQDVRRAGATVGEDNGRGGLYNFRLAAMAVDGFPDAAEQESITKLASQYLPTRAAADGVGAARDAAALFERTPVWKGGRYNPDRRKVDALAERSGLVSMTREEVLAVVDGFALAVGASLDGIEQGRRED